MYMCVSVLNREREGARQSSNLRKLQIHPAGPRTPCNVANPGDQDQCAN